jgi:hypothetical protein
MNWKGYGRRHCCGGILLEKLKRTTKYFRIGSFNAEI